MEWETTQKHVENITTAPYVKFSTPICSKDVGEKICVSAMYEIAELKKKSLGEIRRGGRESDKFRAKKKPIFEILIAY